MRLSTLSLTIASCAALALLLVTANAHAQNTEIAEIVAGRKAERKSFSDAEIIMGFDKIAFGAEMSLAGDVEVIRKFDKPIRIYIEDRGRPDRRNAIRRTIDDIRRHIKGIEIAQVSKAAAANYFVTLIRERNFPGAMRRAFGARTARRIIKSLEPQCISGFRKDSAFRITRSTVILVTDVDEFTFYDCAYEELLQALGPINDDPSVPWSMFNDDVQKGFFDIYDQLLLNILYHPRIRPGMTKNEVHAILPEVLPQVRDWVNEVNGLPR